MSRREPEALLEEVLSNRRLFLTQIVERRVMKPHAEWGMHARLKTEVEAAGYGLFLTKLHRGVVPHD